MIQRVFIFACLFMGSIAFGASQMSLSALERYASAAAKASQENQLDSGDEFKAAAYETYMLGFFGGLGAAEMIYGKKEEDQKITGDISQVPDWMDDPAKSAPSVLAFIRRHCPPDADKQKIAASYILHAWYVFEHPKAQLGERLGGWLALTDLCKWGEDFPDAQVLYKKITENFVESGNLDDKHLLNDKGNHLIIGNIGVDIPDVPGLYRIDGRMKMLDEAVNRMAKAGDNKVWLLLGTKSDHENILKGIFPSMERTVTIQQSTKLSGVVPLEGFELMCDDIASMVSKNGLPEAKKLFEEISQATTDSLQALAEPFSKAALGEPQMLGVVEKDNMSLCHSMLVPGKVHISGEEIKVTQATTVAVIYVDGYVLSVYVSAKYTTPSDLQWTVGTAKYIRDSILLR